MTMESVLVSRLLAVVLLALSVAPDTVRCRKPVVMCFRASEALELPLVIAIYLQACRTSV